MSTKQLYTLSLAALLLAACSGGAEQKAESKPEAATSQESSQPAAKPGQVVYKVVSQPDYPPFASRDEKGQIAGLDYDLLNAIAEKQNFALEFRPHDMNGLLDTLDNGSADIVATGVNITPERLEKFEFSEPYIEGHWAVLLDKSNQDKIKSFADLKDKPISVQEHSLSETQLKATGITSKIVPVKTVYLGVSASKEGGQSVAVYDIDSILSAYAKNYPNFYVITDNKSGSIPFGFVMKKGNTELKAKIDAGLEQIRADGTYQKIIDKYYN